jgi:hypothetical protein
VFRLNIQVHAMGYGLETIIGPIEIKHVIPETKKMDTCSLVLIFTKFNISNSKPDICYNEN